MVRSSSTVDNTTSGSLYATHNGPVVMYVGSDMFEEVLVRCQISFRRSLSARNDVESAAVRVINLGILRFLSIIVLKP